MLGVGGGHDGDRGAVVYIICIRSAGSDDVGGAATDEGYLFDVGGAAGDNNLIGVAFPHGGVGVDSPALGVVPVVVFIIV